MWYEAKVSLATPPIQNIHSPHWCHNHVARTVEQSPIMTCMVRYANKNFFKKLIFTFS